MKPRYIVIASPAGQLGNRLIQFSNFMVFARQNKCILLNPGFNEYAHYFEYTGQQLSCRYPCSPSTTAKAPSARMRSLLTKSIRSMMKHPLVKRYFYTDGTVYERIGLLPSSLAVHLKLGTDDFCDLDNCHEPLLEKSKNSNVVFFSGWKYRAKTHFDDYADEIRHLFTPKKHYLDNFQHLLQDRKGSDLLIGFHIRHGDYKTHRNGRFFYSLEQYKQKMEEVTTLFGSRKILFLVCSNGGFSTQDFEGFNVTMGTNEQLEDMYTLAHCDYIIGPPSTFTAWASFWGRVPLQHIYNLQEPLDMAKFKSFDGQAFIDLDQAFN